MADRLPDGLDDSAMIAAIAWEIVNYSYLRTAYFSERPSDEVFANVTNAFIKARSAIYHGKLIQDEEE